MNWSRTFVSPGARQFLLPLLLLPLFGCGTHIPSAGPMAETSESGTATHEVTPADLTSFQSWDMDPVDPQAKILEYVEPYYVLVRLTDFSIWGTGNLSPEAFERLQLPMMWIKDSVDHMTVEAMRWHRSPAVDDDDIAGPPQPTETTVIDGVEFERVVQVVETNAPIAGAPELEVAKIRKFQEVIYPAKYNNHLRMLVNPRGERFVLINRDPEREKPAAEPPEGWRYEDLKLERDLVVELFGTLLSIHDRNGDLFQGPVVLK